MTPGGKKWGKKIGKLVSLTQIKVSLKWNITRHVYAKIYSQKIIYFLPLKIFYLWRVSLIKDDEKKKSRMKLYFIETPYLYYYFGFYRNILHEVSIGSMTLHKKWRFLLSNSSPNVTKFAVSCGFGHIH